MTTNVLPDRVIRTVFFSRPAAIAVFVGMLLLTTCTSRKLAPYLQREHRMSESSQCKDSAIRLVVSVIFYCTLYH